MKNYEIYNIVESYNKTNGELKLPASVSWKRRLNMKKLIDAYEVIKEAITDINKEYANDEHAVRIENGNWKVNKEYHEELNKRQLELMEQDTPIDIQKVSIDDLGDTTISDLEMDTLDFMIE